MRRDRVRWLASAAFVAIAMAVPLTRDRVAAIVGLRNSYTCGSIVLLLSAAALTRLWPDADSDMDLRAYRWPTAWIGGAALAFGLCFWMASALLPALFGGPLDFYKADMLPVIGFTDDAAVLATAIKLVASHLRPEHRETAREKLQELKKL